jgi:hypothetical protein
LLYCVAARRAQVGKDKDVGYDPCCVAYFSNGEYICVGGTNRKVGLVTKEGTRLTDISEHEAWCAQTPPPPPPPPPPPVERLL